MRTHSITCAFIACLLIGLSSPFPAAGQAASGTTGSSRIVALGGDVTEILYALGAGSQIVGIDTTSQHPPEALREKPNVGYLRQLSTEGILALAPTLILANDKAGPSTVVAALVRARADVVMIPDDPSAEGVARKVKLIAAAIGAEDSGVALAAKIEGELADVRRQVEQVSGAKRGLFVLSVEGGRLVVGGRDTAADAIFTLAGVRNAAAGVRGFKPIAAEGLLELAPDIVFVMHRSQPGAPAADRIADIPAFRLTPAGEARRLVSVDGLLLLGFGPRIAEAVLTVARAAYPEALPGSSR